MRECNDIVTIVDVIHQDPYNRSLGMDELKSEETGESDRGRRDGISK